MVRFVNLILFLSHIPEIFFFLFQGSKQYCVIGCEKESILGATHNLEGEGDILGRQNFKILSTILRS